MRSFTEALRRLLAILYRSTLLIGLAAGVAGVVLLLSCQRIVAPIAFLLALFVLLGPRAIAVGRIRPSFFIAAGCLALLVPCDLSFRDMPGPPRLMALYKGAFEIGESVHLGGPATGLEPHWVIVW